MAIYPKVHKNKFPMARQFLKRAMEVALFTWSVIRSIEQQDFTNDCTFQVPRIRFTTMNIYIIALIPATGFLISTERTRRVISFVKAQTEAAEVNFFRNFERPVHSNVHSMDVPIDIGKTVPSVNNPHSSPSR